VAKQVWVKAQIPGVATRRFDPETPIAPTCPARMADLTRWPVNVAIADPTWVRGARLRNFAHILPPGTPPTDDVATWWTQFEAAARWNDSVFARWKKEGNDIRTRGGVVPKEFVPRGFVYSLEFRDPKKCLLESVGPDMT